MPKFAPGVSGNPQGARLHKSGRLRARLLEAAPDVVEKLITRAKAGDPVATRLFLERVLPVLKPEAERVEFAIPAGTSSTGLARLLLAHAADGSLAPDTVGELLGSLAKLSAIEQNDEIKRRLDELEFKGIA